MNKTHSYSKLVPGSSCALAIRGHKKAALLFDKIWASPVTASLLDIPEQLRFYNESIMDSANELLPAKDVLDEIRKLATLPAGSFDSSEENLHKRVEDIYGLGEMFYFSVIEAHLSRKIELVPVFGSYDSFDRNYPKGASLGYLAVLDNLPNVSENTLSWKQILEFREDKQALRKYRDLRLWLSDGFNAKSLRHAIDLVATRVCDYEAVVKKHGLQTGIGSISFLLDPKRLGPTAVSAAATGLATNSWYLSAIVSGISIGSQVVAYLAEQKVRRLDLQQNKFRDVAIIYDLKRLINKHANKSIQDTP